ncbi:Cytochrome c1 2- heme protein- mitochondrial [Striga hermonthica]|uniref:Cytochrome c1 2- heme protein- mitochondrial n=1 Tax=Striga hermonthica TaxID=68872 RepID=A0A9N7N763_STRHE|nr:Cytochrome c1 2- heme protein- mitochondrial [Striga hermonthica]
MRIQLAASAGYCWGCAIVTSPSANIDLRRVLGRDLGCPWAKLGRPDQMTRPLALTSERILTKRSSQLHPAMVDGTSRQLEEATPARPVAHLQPRCRPEIRTRRGRRPSPVKRRAPINLAKTEVASCDEAEHGLGVPDYPWPHKGILSSYDHASQAARFANGGAYPPDLSLITKARHDGQNYVFALLTGYRDPPAGIFIREGLQYNPYFPSGAIAMPKMLNDGAVEYEDDGKRCGVIFVLGSRAGNGIEKADGVQVDICPVTGTTSGWHKHIRQASSLPGTHHPRARECSQPPNRALAEDLKSCPRESGTSRPSTY